MTVNWQDIAALAIVLVAAVLFVRRITRGQHSGEGCGDCQAHRLSRQARRRAAATPASDQ